MIFLTGREGPAAGSVLTVTQEEQKIDNGHRHQQPTIPELDPHWQNHKIEMSIATPQRRSRNLGRSSQHSRSILADPSRTYFESSRSKPVKLGLDSSRGDYHYHELKQEEVDHKTEDLWAGQSYPTAWKLQLARLPEDNHTSYMNHDTHQRSLELSDAALEPEFHIHQWCHTNTDPSGSEVLTGLRCSQ